MMIECLHVLSGRGHRVATLRAGAASGAWALALLTVALLAIAPDLARGQGLTQAFGGFAASPDAPIDIQARRLDVDDKAKRAVFTGEVVARQDTFVMNSKTLEIRYAARQGAKKTVAASSGLGGGSTEITHLTARGDVFIQSVKEETQTARGNWAEFDVKKRIITMGDVVTLKQGQNVIRGTRLVINLTTGRSSVQSSPSANATTSGNGRIRMVITPDRKLRSNLRSRGRTGTKKRRSNSASRPQRGGQ